MSGSLRHDYGLRLLSRKLARLACCLLAVAGTGLATCSVSVGPLVRALSPINESERSPAEEREPNSAESTGVVHLTRCDGRRLPARPLAMARSLLPLRALTIGRSFTSDHDRPPMEHALRDGLGAPLRI